MPLKSDAINEKPNLPDTIVLVCLHTEAAFIEHLDPSILQSIDIMPIVISSRLGRLIESQASIAGIDIGIALALIVKGVSLGGNARCLG